MHAVLVYVVCVQTCALVVLVVCGICHVGRSCARARVVLVLMGWVATSQRASADFLSVLCTFIEYFD